VGVEQAVAGLLFIGVDIQLISQAMGSGILQLEDLPHRKVSFIINFPSLVGGGIRLGRWIEKFHSLISQRVGRKQR